MRYLTTIRRQLPAPAGQSGQIENGQTLLCSDVNQGQHPQSRGRLAERANVWHWEFLKFLFWAT